MSNRILLVTPGLDPVRVVRAAFTLGVSQLLLPVTPTTEFVAPALESALVSLLGTDVEAATVEVDEWSFPDALNSLRAGVDQVVGPDESLEVIVGGGTKPIVAACAVLAMGQEARTWVLDELGDQLIGDEGAVSLREPEVNMQPEALAKLYAVHHLDESPEPVADDETLLRWLEKRLGGSQYGPGEDAARTFEQAVMALARRILPDDYDVWGPQQFVLRDLHSPENPAEEEGTHYRYRQFEVDGLVVRGTRIWVVESKYVGKKMTQTAAMTALAELDRRRQHIGGFTCGGVLVMLNDERADAMLEGRAPFQPAGTQVLSQRDLREALDSARGGVVSARPIPEMMRVLSM